MTRDNSVQAASPRFDTIDVLRGFSILAVVLLHIYLRLLFSGYPLKLQFARPVLRLFFLNGGNGVTVFFAISGFLITLTSLRRFGSLKKIDIAMFYRIRFARIAPLLTILVAVLSALALLHIKGFAFSAKQPPLWRAVFSAFTFHLNWLEGHYGYLPANWDVLWSLSIEETFYLFFPLVCAALMRARHGLALLVAVLLAFVAMGPFARGVWTMALPVWNEKSYLGGMDGIALGCLTALLTHRFSNGQRKLSPSLLMCIQVAGACILAAIAYGPKWLWKIFPGKNDFYGTLLAFAVCMVMLSSVLRRKNADWFLLSRLTAPIRWYGRHSYEIYMTHEFIVVWGVFIFLRVHPNTGPTSDSVAPYQLTWLHMAAWCAAMLLLTAPLGWAVSRFISEPLNRLFRGASPPRSNTNSTA